MRNRGNYLILALVLALLAGTVALIALRSPVLGLDLRGGAEIVLQAQPDKGKTVTPEILDQSVTVLRNRVDSLGVNEPDIRKDGSNRIDIAIAGVKDPQRVFDIVGSTGKLYFIDLQNGLTPGVSRSILTGSGIRPKSSLYALLTAAKPQVKNGQYDAFYAFRRDKAHTLVLPDAAKTRDQLLQRLGPLRIAASSVDILGVPHDKLAVSCSSYKQCPGGPPAQPKTTKSKETLGWYMFDLPAPGQRLEGKMLDSAKADVDTRNNQPIVTMNFNGQGTRLFHEITRTLAQQGKKEYDQARASGQATDPTGFFHQFAIVLSNQLESYPYIDFQQNPDGINGGSEISGLTQQEANDTALVLRSGSLPVEFVPLQTNQVSATLGKASLRQGLIAGLAGLLVVMIYMIVFYRFLGLIADFALLIYAALFYGLILAIPVTMTLPGIAGMILTIGVAADANVVVFERIKEEVRAGRTVRAAISGGYAKGFKTIIDANVVTLITAFVLFISSQASVKGFAFLLALGVIVSMFTAVAATRAMLGILGGFRWFNNAAFMGATAKPVRWKLDFIGRKSLWFAVSGAVVVAGLVSLGTQGLNQGIDFKGGTRVTFKLQHGAKATPDQVRSLAVPLAPHLHDAVVRGTGSSSGGTYTAFQLDSKQLAGAEIVTLKERLQSRYGGEAGVPSDAFNATSVSASFGSDILRGAVLAFCVSMFLIVVYMAFRFDWRYALPMIAALIHDLLITVGVYSLTGREVTSSTVAAVLTILGYSLYDTIIVFDRVRENEQHLRKHTYGQIVNISLWETMTRSLNTSFITLLPIASLFLFGGSTLKDFAFALLIGILSGAYSSFFIASPLLVMLKNRESEFSRRQGSDELPHFMLRDRPPAMAIAMPVPAEAPEPVGAVSGATAGPPSGRRSARPIAAPPTPATPPTVAGEPPAPADGEDARAAARERRSQRRGRKR